MWNQWTLYWTDKESGEEGNFKIPRPNALFIGMPIDIDEYRYTVTAVSTPTKEVWTERIPFDFGPKPPWEHNN